MHDKDRLRLQREQDAADLRRERAERHPDSLLYREKDRDGSDGLFWEASPPQDQERFDHRPIPTRIPQTFMDRVEEFGFFLAKHSIKRRWLFRVRITVTSKRTMVTPPGTLSVRALRFLFSKKAFEAVFAQAIADMREEYFEALDLGHRKKARWIVVRDHIGLALTVGLYLATTVGKKVRGIWTLIS